MPRDNKTMKRPQSQRNDSSSAHYERQKAVGNGNSVGEYDLNQFMENSIGTGDPLFETRLKTFLSGVPYIGPMVQSYDQIRYLEDYYKNTGKIPTYPFINSPGGYSQLGNVAGHAVGGMVNKIANGSNDLYQFYSGEPDNFRKLMNGMYG